MPSTFTFPDVRRERARRPHPTRAGTHVFLGVFQEDQHTLHQDAGGRLVVIGDAAVGEEMPVARLSESFIWRVLGSLVPTSTN